MLKNTLIHVMRARIDKVIRPKGIRLKDILPRNKQHINCI
jgi:hypothetical protein